MSNQVKASTGGVTKTADDQNITKQGGVSAPAKEQEPKAPSDAEEGKMMAEIRSVSEKQDAQTLAEVQEIIGKAARLAQPKPYISPDLEDFGVTHPQAEAERVVEKGTTLELPIDEATYEKGLHTKIASMVVNKTVVGVSSLVTLAMWVGRLIKMAHKHALKVVFRREAK